MLEDRLTPATVNWLAFISGEFSNGLNWEAFDNGLGGPVVHRPPTNGDDVNFRPAPFYGSATAEKQSGALQVIGDVYFEAGEFKAKVNGTPTSVERDLWRCTGTFTFIASAKITPTVLYEPITGVAGRFWQVVIATGKFTNTKKPTMSIAWDCAITGDDKILQIFKA